MTGAERKRTFALQVNGVRRDVVAHEEMPLLWALRDLLGLTGTKYGCGLGVCGACSVLEGERAVRSCQVPMRLADGRSYTTIEGLSADASHPVQRAWLAEDVAQCGYCQAGMILEAVALLAAKASPTDAEIQAALEGVLCRCGTYARVRRAVRRAASLAHGGG
ncbi:MAG TPA: (2Fe-2S)-binding protein [Vicinamibacteria bacterium]|nr:(2Fe-2S)-binding protein [Vicinamibacteria bacterium]